MLNLQVSWIRQRDWHILSSGNIGTFTKDQRFQLLHVPNSHEWTLMIKYLHNRDEGTYVCQVYKHYEIKFIENENIS